jgi:hypothetical protein
MSYYECGPKWDRRIIEVTPKPKDAIMMTGGIDSYVLYHLLDNPIIFNIKRKDRFDTANYIKELTGSDVIEVDEETTGNDRFRLGSHKIMREYDIGHLYTGINHTPPLEYFPEFDSHKKPQRIWRIDHDQFKAPFLHLYKYHIIDLGLSLGLDLNVTRSCLYDREVNCGKCWQCQERQWGFDQLLHK